MRLQTDHEVTCVCITYVQTPAALSALYWLVLTYFHCIVHDEVVHVHGHMVKPVVSLVPVQDPELG